MSKVSFAMMTMVSVALVAGCAAEEGGAEEAPSAAAGGAEGQQIITSTNVDGTWTAQASTSAPPFTGLINGSVTFTGPSGATRKMGACNLRRYSPDVACTTTADCTSAPSTLPTGGQRYCAAPDASGQKYCYYRPGTQADFCMGSPGLGGTAVSAGTYTKQVSSQFPQSAWISQACFEGCSVVAPSNSPSAAGYFPLGYYTLNGGSQTTTLPNNNFVYDGMTLDIYLDSRITPLSFTWSGMGGCASWSTSNGGQHLQCVKAASHAPLPLTFTHASGTSETLTFFPW